MGSEISRLLQQRDEYRKWEKDAREFTVNLKKFSDDTIKDTVLESSHIRSILLDEVNRLEKKK